jgi:Nickel responsive protein SCO4226-like
MLKKFLVEYDIKGVGELTSEELGFVARDFNAAASIIAGIQWLHTYVAADKLYSVFLAESADLLTEHSIVADLPVSNAAEITATIDPSAESSIGADTRPSSCDTVRSWFAERHRLVG